MDISLPDLGLGILAVTEGQVLKYCVLVKSVQSAGKGLVPFWQRDFGLVGLEPRDSDKELAKRTAYT